MKNVRLILTGAIVTAIVSGALAFKPVKEGRNLFRCEQNVCVSAPYSDISGTTAGDINTLYKVNNAVNPACPKQGQTTGCATHPTQAFLND